MHADRRHAAAVQLAGHLEQRRDRVAQHGGAALQRVQALDVPARRAALEDLRLDVVELGLDGVEQREVAVDHRVHQRIEHEAGAMAQQLAARARSARARPGSAAGCGCAPTARSSAPTKIATSPTVHLAVLDLEQVHHDEDGVAVLLDLRPLVAVARILDGQLVQAELAAASATQLVVGGVAQRHPDEAFGPVHPVADVLDRDVGQLAAVLVGDAVDQHGGGLSCSARASSHAARARRRARRRSAAASSQPASASGSDDDGQRARARPRPRPSAQRRGRRRAPGSARSTLTRGSPRKPSHAPLGVALDQRAHVGLGQAARRAPRAPPGSRPRRG